MYTATFMGNVYAGVTSYCGCSLTVYFNLNELLLNENPNDGCLYTLPKPVIEKFGESKREQRTEFPSLSLPISLPILGIFSKSPMVLQRQSGRGTRDLEIFWGKFVYNFLRAGKRYFKFCDYEGNILESRV